MKSAVVVSVVVAVLLAGCSGSGTGTTGTTAAPATTTTGAATLPNHQLTPGSVFPAATAARICAPGYARSVRAVPEATRRAVFAAYRIDYGQRSGYELDHLIPLELGGDNSQRNLWPEPRSGPDAASVKDHLENHLHALVCAGQIPLAEAQHAMAGNWYAANAKYGAIKARTTTTAQPAPTPAAPAPTTPPGGGAGGGSVYYANCAAARAAGAAPLHRGEPGYRPALDRDGDGVACE